MNHSFSSNHSFMPPYILSSNNQDSRQATTDSPCSYDSNTSSNQYHPSYNIPLPQKSSQNNTFVHKLYNMVLDDQFQHLIAWNYTGASFIVCNILDFSREVLPKHFKHNNFSSFVRQLNMYGFHKVNKSPRGHRTLAENQIWEFSHAKFLRDQPELLDTIKRKTMESETVRRESDLQTHLAMMQVSQSDLVQQLNHLYDTFSQIVKDLHDTKQRQEYHHKLVKNCYEYISQQSEGQLPQKLKLEYEKLGNNKQDQHFDTNPTIFIASYEQQQQQQQQAQQPQPSFMYHHESNSSTTNKYNKNHRVLSNIPFPDLLNPTLHNK